MLRCELPLKLERRSTPSAFWGWAAPVLALAITTVLGAALFALLGKDPVAGLRMFFVEPLRSGYALGELALKATPLLITALGLGLCFRANVWNIGAEGQFILGSLAASGVALSLDASSGAASWLIVLAAGMVGGAVWAAIVAALRTRFNANEILVSLMLVYVAVQLLGYLVYGPWKDPLGYNFPQSRMFDSPALVPKVATGTRLHVGAIMAVVLAALVWLVLFRTRLGFGLQVGGIAPQAAAYAGFDANRAVWVVLLASGALAGLAGALEVAGPIGQLTPHASAGYGFAAIIVAFVGRLHPLGMVASAVLLSMFLIGGELAQSRLATPRAITGVFQGLLLFALLACDTLIDWRVRWKKSAT